MATLPLVSNILSKNTKRSKWKLSLVSQIPPLSIHTSIKFCLRVVVN